MHDVIEKYRRLHRTDWGCLTIALAFFILSLVVITAMLYKGDS